MNLQALLNSPRAGRLVFGLSQRLSPRLGERLAQTLAAWLVNQRETPLVRAIMANQWVAHGESLTADELYQVTRAALTYLALAFYHLFHYFDDPRGLQNLVDFPPIVEELIARTQEGRQGAVVAGLHMAGFDVAALAAARRGFKAITLSLPQPSASVEWQHSLRRKVGLEVLPGTLPNLRPVIQRLKGGETVLTGIERPMPGLKYAPRFFGRPTLLPTHHVYLALKAEVPVIVLAPILTEEGRYRIAASEYIRLQPYADRHQEMLTNAERLLEIAQGIICQAPTQWVVPHPLWPEVFAEHPHLFNGKRPQQNGASR